MTSLVRRAARFVADQRGAVLIVVLVFSLIILVVGLAFMSAGSGEARNAQERYASERAFWLAESGVQRFASEAWADGNWPEDNVNQPVGDTLGGADARYDILIRDTTIAGVDRAYRVISTGTAFVPGAADTTQRRLDVALSLIYAPFDSFAVFAEGDVTFKSASASAGVSGKVHSDGNISVKKTMPPGWSEGYNIDPPAIYTDADSFGSAATTTYYYVQCFVNGGRDSAKILDRDKNEIDPARRFGGVSLVGGIWTFAVDAADFSWTGTRFPVEPGRSAVVVNFGEEQLANLGFAVGKGQSIRSTIINTRYKAGAPPTYLGRIDKTNWEGGYIDLRNGVVFEPANGVSFVDHDLDPSSGGPSTQIGTDSNPGLVYLTNDLLKMTGNIQFHGTIICLGSVYVSGSSNLTFDEDYIDKLPGALSNAFKSGPTLAVNLLSWREIPRW